MVFESGRVERKESEREEEGNEAHLVVGLDLDLLLGDDRVLLLVLKRKKRGKSKNRGEKERRERMRGRRD